MTPWRFSKTALDELLLKVRPYVPFVSLNIVWRNLAKDAQYILDVGCGKGEPMQFLNRRRRYFTVGIDIFQPYIEKCRLQGIHDDYVMCDVRNLPFREKSFDIALCLEVLEHMDRKDGERLLDEMERVARKQIILSTPLGPLECKPYDGNLYLEHKYFWNTDDLQQLGYKIIPLGIRDIRDETGFPYKLAQWCQFFRYLELVAWVMAGPVTRFLPGMAGQMVCVKNLT